MAWKLYSGVHGSYYVLLGADVILEWASIDAEIGFSTGG